MPRLVYACRLELATADRLESVLSAYGAWLGHHYKERRKIDGFSIDFRNAAIVEGLLPRHVVQNAYFKTDAAEAFSIDWTYPAENDDGLLWRNSIRVGAFADRCSVEHLISIDSVTYRVSPIRFALGSPSVVRDLCAENTVHVGDMQLRATPYRLEISGKKDFLTLLQSSLRRLPIVFLAPYARGEPNHIDAVEMARRLAGVAVVVVADTADVTWELNDTLGRTLSCFNGAARIYWPGFSDTDDPRRHPLYFGARIEMLGAEAVSRAIERLIFAVAASRFVPDKRISDIVQESEQKQRLQRVEAERAAAGADWESIAIETDRELSQAKQTILELQAENANLKANSQLFVSGPIADEAEEAIAADEQEVPETVHAAVEHARNRYFQPVISRKCN